MSLSEKWEEYRATWADARNRAEPSSYWMARLREAFYAGAEAKAEIEELKKQPRQHD